MSHDSETSRLSSFEDWPAGSDEPQSLVSGAGGDTLGEDRPYYFVAGGTKLGFEPVSVAGYPPSECRGDASEIA